MYIHVQPPSLRRRSFLNADAIRAYEAPPGHLIARSTAHASHLQCIGSNMACLGGRTPAGSGSANRHKSSRLRTCSYSMTQFISPKEKAFSSQPFHLSKSEPSLSETLPPPPKLHPSSWGGCKHAAQQLERVQLQDRVTIYLVFIKGP